MEGAPGTSGLFPPRPSLPPPQQVPLGPTCGLIVVHVDSLQLQVTIPVVRARGVDAMLITDHLPELGGGRGAAARTEAGEGAAEAQACPGLPLLGSGPPTTSLAATCPPARCTGYLEAWREAGNETAGRERCGRGEAESPPHPSGLGTGGRCSHGEGLGLFVRVQGTVGQL